MNLSTREIKAFVPAKDFVLSQQFYQDLGFTKAFSDDTLAYFHLGHTSFLLQNFHRDGYTDNFMMHLLVEDVDAWHAHLLAQNITERYNVDLTDPQDQPWRMREILLGDPSGVLWRIANNIE